MALSAIPLLVASGRSVFTSARIRARDLIAVVTAAFLLSGSHNITLMWGSIYIVFLAIVSLVAFAPVRLSRAQWSRVAALAGTVAIGTGLNAWFLFPDLRYGLDTIIAKQDANEVPRTFFATRGLLLNPLRPAAGILPWGRDLRYSLPWMFTLWAVVIALLLWRNREASAKRAFVGVFVVSLIYLALIVRQGIWHSLPHVLYNVQFPSRLHGYLLLATALLVLLALKWQATAPRLVKRSTTIVLVAFIVFNVGAATWQVWRVRSE
jgi:hypothetical protein